MPEPDLELEKKLRPLADPLPLPGRRCHMTSAPAASTTRRVAPATSGPMRSPGMSTTGVAAKAQSSVRGEAARFRLVVEKWVHNGASRRACPAG
jgi:hypothetical protein